MFDGATVSRFNQHSQLSLLEHTEMCYLLEATTGPIQKFPGIGSGGERVVFL